MDDKQFIRAQELGIESLHVEQDFESNERIRNARKLITLVHTTIEQQLEQFITLHFTYSIKPDATADDSAAMIVNLMPMFEWMKFTNKVKYCLEYGYITEEIAKAAYSIDEKRNLISHMTIFSKQVKLKQFENNDDYIKLLEMLHRVSIDLSEIINTRSVGEAIPTSKEIVQRYKDKMAGKKVSPRQALKVVSKLSQLESLANQQAVKSALQKT